MIDAPYLANVVRVATATLLATQLCVPLPLQAAVVQRGETAATAATLATAQQKLTTKRVPFVPNAGQWDARAAFAAQTFAGTMFVTKQGELVYSLPGKPIAVGADVAVLRSQHEATPGRRLQKPGERSPGWALSETLVDAKGQPRSMTQGSLKAPAGYRPMEGKVSYAIGTDIAKHAANLNTYERVNLGDMYPGINVQLRATGNNVEKIFTVAAQREPTQIQIKLSGAQRLEINTKGELIAHTGNGPVAFTAPIAFQETASGTREHIEVAYALDTDTQTYGFSVGHYDRARPLTIDPLLQSSYLGGGGSDSAAALAIHPYTGDVYVAGYTASTNLPGTIGGAQSAAAGSNEGFVTRFNAALTERLQSSYFGGGGSEQALALAISPASGEVYVAGYSYSADLLGTGGGAQSASGGTADGFVTRFNAALTQRLQSTYAGGSGVDLQYAMAINPVSGDVYVAGAAYSADLPGTSGGAQLTTGGSGDGFITRFNAALTQRLQSTYLGGSGADTIYALAIAPGSGDVYAAGSTASTNLPGTSGGAQSASGGVSDGFVARFNAALTQRLQSTYLGGTSDDYIKALSIHPASGEIYVAGDTSSANLPGTSGGAQSALGGGRDGFVTRFNAALTQRLQSSFVGGSFTDYVNALAIHPTSGEVYAAGTTVSTNLPGTTDGAQSAFGGAVDAFVTRFNAALTQRLQSSYLGSAGADYLQALVIHPVSGDVYVAGQTDSTNLPGASGGAQSVSGGGNEAFVARISGDLTLNNRIPNSINFLHQSNVPPGTTRTSNEVTIAGLTVNTGQVYVAGAANSQFCVSTVPGCCTALPAVPAGCAAPTYVSDWLDSISFLGNGDYVTLRHSSASPSGTAETRFIVSSQAYPFRSSTGNATISCNLDMNADNALSPTKEGLILLRAMLGFTGAAVVSGTGVTLTAWDAMRPQINTNCGTSF